MWVNSTLYPRLSGNGVLAFSDPAGSKACLALAQILYEIEPDRKLRLFSNRSWDFYSQWPLEVTVETETPPLVADWVFTGTSSPDTSGRFELDFISRSRAAGVACWSFVDHWTAIAYRFQGRDGQTILPDQVVVLDERAANIAVAEGIPRSLLVIHPNPYLEYIATHWRPRLSRSDIRRAIGVPSSSHMLLYAPDTISLNPEPGWGFDESSVLVDLIEIVKELPGVALVIKEHPLQPRAAWQSGSESATKVGVPLYFAGNAVAPLELMSAADLIVGFHSNFLIEAAVLDCPMVRYFPASGCMDAIAHLNIGRKLEDKDALRRAITELLA